MTASQIQAANEEGSHMGLLMAFYAGDKEQIAASFASEDADPLWEQLFVAAFADFSLHLSPLDLDFLTEEACRMVSVPPMTLTDSLEEHLGGGEVSSADVVSDQWVGVFAGLSEDKVEELGRRWMTRVPGEYREEPMPPTADTIRAIHELLQLCRAAWEQKLPVVYTWCL